MKTLVIKKTSGNIRKAPIRFGSVPVLKKPVQTGSVPNGSGSKTVRFREKRFFLTAVWKNVFWTAFRKCFFSVAQKSMEKAIPKHRPAKNPASQKAKPSPSKNRFKFQNNNPKTGRRALARRPVFGRRALARRVVVLKFVSIFCRTLLGFLAELFCWLDSLMAYALGWFFPWILGRWKKVFSKSGPKNIFPNSGHSKKLIFAKTWVMKKYSGPPNLFTDVFF